MKTRSILLNSRPEGKPTLENFRFEDIDLPEITDGQLLLKSLFVSVDPYMRGRMRDAKSYVPPFKLDEPINGGIVAKVVESKNPQFSAGDAIMGYLPWQEYNISDGKGLQKADPQLAPLSYYLGILGMPGLTAYFGLLDVGQPKEGETVVISGAAGAVGSVVGQIGKIKGCKVVGVAGSDEKIRYLKEELGFDEGINYKAVQDMNKAMREACPNGVDVYFDNVGGEVTDAVYNNLNKHARIALCGQIAYYNNTELPVAPRIETRLLINSAKLQGFIVSDYEARFGEGIQQLGLWLKEGKLKFEETITEGFDRIPRAFFGLFEGQNTGKQLVKVADYNEK